MSGPIGGVGAQQGFSVSQALQQSQNTQTRDQQQVRPDAEAQQPARTNNAANTRAAIPTQATETETRDTASREDLRADTETSQLANNATGGRGSIVDISV